MNAGVRISFIRGYFLQDIPESTRLLNFPAILLIHLARKKTVLIVEEIWLLKSPEIAHKLNAFIGCRVLAHTLAHESPELVNA